MMGFDDVGSLLSPRSSYSSCMKILFQGGSSTQIFEKLKSCEIFDSVLFIYFYYFSIFISLIPLKC